MLNLNFGKKKKRKKASRQLFPKMIHSHYDKYGILAMRKANQGQGGSDEETETLDQCVATHYKLHPRDAWFNQQPGETVTYSSAFTIITIKCSC